MTALQNGDLSLPAMVATRVRGLMAELRLNQADLAGVLGVSRSGISDRLRGAKDFDLGELEPLADRLGVSVTYLLGLSNERSPRRTVSDEGSSGVRYAIRDSNPEPADLKHPRPDAAVIRFPVERTRSAA